MSKAAEKLLHLHCELNLLPNCEIMSPHVGQSNSGRNLRFDSKVGNISRRRSDLNSSDLIKLIEIPFSPFQNDYGEGDDEDFDFAVVHRNYSTRQEYLRSFTFCKKQTMPEKMKKSLRRLTAAAWAVIACNHGPSYQAKRLKEKMTFKASRLFNGSRCVRLPSRPSMPSCFRVAAI